MVVCHTYKFTTMPQYMLMSWYELHLVHLIFDAKKLNLMQKTSGHIFFGHFRKMCWDTCFHT